MSVQRLSLFFRSRWSRVRRLAPEVKDDQNGSGDEHSSFVMLKNHLRRVIRPQSPSHGVSAGKGARDQGDDVSTNARCTFRWVSPGARSGATDGSCLRASYTRRYLRGRRWEHEFAMTRELATTNRPRLPSKRALVFILSNKVARGNFLLPVHESSRYNFRWS